MEKEFGDTTTVQAQFRFKLPALRRLHAALDFPAVVRTPSRHVATSEEVFLFMLRCLSYPNTLTTLAWDSGRSCAAHSELIDAGITHVYNRFAHLRDSRSLECWARHFPRHASASRRAEGTCAAVQELRGGVPGRCSNPSMSPNPT